MGLLKQGIPYEAIMEMSEKDIKIVMGVLAALNERETEQIAQQQRMQENKRSQRMKI